MSIEASINSSISGDILSSIGSEGLAFGAIAQYDDSSIIGSNPVTEWKNKAGGGTAFDLDVVVGTGANLATLDAGVALLTGVAGDFFSTPDSVAASITGDIDIRVRVAMDDWTPAAIDSVIGKWPEGGQNSYLLQYLTTGKLRLLTTSDGSASIFQDSTVGAGFTDGSTHWLRVTLDVDNGATQHVYTFFTSDDITDDPDLVTWTQLGTTVTVSAVVSIFDGTGSVETGAHQGGVAAPLAGRCHRAAILNGIDGTIAVDFNPALATVNTSTFTAATGEVWTANGDAFVNATGFTGIYSRGSVGLETTTGQTINSPVTVFAVVKPTLAAPGADQFIFDAKSEAGERMAVFSDESNSDRFSIFQGGGTIGLSQGYDNDFSVFTGQFLGTASTKLTQSDVGSVTSDAGSNNFDFVSIFMVLGGTLTIQGLFLEFVVYDRALNASEILQNQTFLEGKYKT